MHYHGFRCAKCSGLVMTSTDGNGRLVDECPRCDWGETPPTYPAVPEEPLPVRPGRRRLEGQVITCRVCGVVVPKRGPSQVYCGTACAVAGRQKREREGRARRARLRGKERALRALYANPRMVPCATCGAEVPDRSGSTVRYCKSCMRARAAAKARIRYRAALLAEACA